MKENIENLAPVTPRERQAEATVALVGTPNSGKTTLFNALTGLRQKTGNYPGVTVERKSGLVTEGFATVELLDLPGLYSLAALNPEETVTADVLDGLGHYEKRPDAVLVVVDGSALDRSLGLLASVLAEGLPTAVVVTMVDEIKARGGRLDIDALQRELGVPVVGVVGHRGVGMDRVRGTLLGHRTWPVAKDFPEMEEPAARFAWAKELLERCLHEPVQPHALSRRIDRWVLHPVSGPLIFLGVMATLFQAIFSWAGPAMDLIDAGIGAVAGAVEGALPPGLLTDLIAHGVIEGVGAVVVFLPQILILFFFINLLEDVGYMARAAFLMDRIMGWVGLQGRSFVALLSSNACAIPGVMATRSIPSPQDRLATILVAPFMTCSARLPVYTLLIAAFVPKRPLVGPLDTQGGALLALYVIGAFTALGAAWVWRHTALKGDILPFYMELPPYRFPTWRNVLLQMWDRASIFMKRAGRIILPAAVILWVTLSFPRLEVPAGTPARTAASLQLENSFAGRFGRAVEPVFAPLGFDWKVDVAVFASLAAREVVVSTLAQIYAVEGGEEDAGGVVDAFRRNLEPAAAFALLAFFLFALQCLSTLAVIARETNGWKWPAVAFGYMFVLAYAAGWAAHHAAKAFGV